MKYLLSATLGTLAIFALSSGASAAIVCNDDGDCWRAEKTYDYPAEANVQIYGDDYEIDENKYELREARPGRGYYRGGVWVDF